MHCVLVGQEYFSHTRPVSELQVHFVLQSSSYVVSPDLRRVEGLLHRGKIDRKNEEVIEEYFIFINHLLHVENLLIKSQEKSSVRTSPISLMSSAIEKEKAI